MVSPHETEPPSEEPAITRLFPVNSSAPAITIRLKAAAKENDCAPLTIAGAPLIVRFAPQVKVINPPNAINKPAIKAETKYPTLFFSKKSAFALPALHNVANSFLNIYVPSLFL